MAFAYNFRAFLANRTSVQSYICSTGSSAFLYFLLFRPEAILLCEINFFLSINDWWARGSRFASSTAFVMTYDSTTFSFYWDSQPSLCVFLLTGAGSFLCVEFTTWQSAQHSRSIFHLFFPFFLRIFQINFALWLQPHTKTIFFFCLGVARSWCELTTWMECFNVKWIFCLCPTTFWCDVSSSSRQSFTCGKMCPFSLSSPL